MTQLLQECCTEVEAKTLDLTNQDIISSLLSPHVVETVSLFQSKLKI